MTLNVAYCKIAMEPQSCCQAAVKLNGFNTAASSFLSPNAGIPVEDRVNIFINSFGSIQETTMVRVHFSPTFSPRQYWQSIPASIESSESELESASACEFLGAMH